MWFVHFKDSKLPGSAKKITIPAIPYQPLTEPPHRNKSAIPNENYPFPVCRSLPQLNITKLN